MLVTFSSHRWLTLNSAVGRTRTYRSLVSATPTNIEYPFLSVSEVIKGVSCESSRGGATAAPRPCTVPLLRGMDTINNSPVPPKWSSVSFDGRRSEFLLHNRLTYLQLTITHPHLSSTPSRTPLCGPCPSSSIPAVCVPFETSEMGVRAAGQCETQCGWWWPGHLDVPKREALDTPGILHPRGPPPPSMLSLLSLAPSLSPTAAALVSACLCNNTRECACIVWPAV
jgi:hypothetical protein